MYNNGLENLTQVIASSSRKKLSLNKASTLGLVDNYATGSGSIFCWDRTPLTKFSRSGVHYYWCTAGREDLVIVKWLFEHFGGCEVPSIHGHLWLL
ncbi:Hypothetical protein PHPALM_9265 [Phytophthora palmivora]|uniref:Uncharacterized protein n=1 Tax=Phytophthora palmivora TaxID=4796 RepID=A0A2P4Y846_9STRA|nr:Hypothetical protein PHPALM_9265 [Phytophthora palmivora]